LKITILIALLWTAGYSSSFGQFSDFFVDKTMRVDYYRVGDHDSEQIVPDKIYQYGIWAGSRINLIDNFNNGRNYIKIYDSQSGKLIFSKGFDSYFAEYQSSAEAVAGKKKAYHESVLIPMPRNKVKFIFEKRDKQKKLYPYFEFVVDPDAVDIIREEPADPQAEITKALINGDSHSKVDIVILAEGYTEKEKPKYQTDLAKFISTIMSTEPYKKIQTAFNIYGIYKPSPDSGVDEPRAGIYKNTVLDITFNSLGSERYVMTENNRTMRDLAALVPYDAIYIMVNHNRYGGGGIYNQFCTFTTDNQFKEYLFIHEFGHSFSGLADEYYTSEVAYNDFYPKGIEPVEPNITALLDSANLKWKAMVTPGTPIPTPWEKADYDTMDLAWQKWRRSKNDQIAALKKNKAPEGEIKKAEAEYAIRDGSHAEKINAYLLKSKYIGQVGAFEGAGYAATGLYRPMLDCIMFSKGNKSFCLVCQNAIKNVIDHYLE